MATCVELSNAAAVGAVGTPVRAGDANGAFNASAADALETSLDTAELTAVSAEVVASVEIAVDTYGCVASGTSCPVKPAIHCWAVSLHINRCLAKSPRSTSIPAYTKETPEPASPLFTVMMLSSTVRLFVLIEVVVPETVKLPAIVNAFSVVFPATTKVPDIVSSPITATVGVVMLTPVPDVMVTIDPKPTV